MIYGINDLKLWSQESAACTFRIYLNVGCNFSWLGVK